MKKQEEKVIMLDDGAEWNSMAHMQIDSFQELADKARAKGNEKEAKEWEANIETIKKMNENESWFKDTGK